MSTSMMKNDCGCGGGGGSSGDCKGGGQGAVCKDVSFKRPRFFAGQLLTEDDLQALMDYVVGKNRLHNRYLFGDGVVCGLSVTCHPCGEGKLNVAPGFALDCCGNDMLVPCTEELDAKALLRDLRKRQLAGYDCGDPCDKKDGNQRTYGLYITYTEVPEDPVAPYSSTDPCGQQACEPTRICEGYRFELRCDCSLEDRTDVFKRIIACIGDLKSAGTALDRAKTAEAQATQLNQALHVLRQDKDTVIPFETTSVEAIRDTEPQLHELKKLSLDNVDEKGSLKSLPSEHALRLDVARFQILTGAVTRFRALSKDDREAALHTHTDLADLLKTAEATIAETGPKILELSKHVITSPTSRTEAEEIVRLAEKFVVKTPGQEVFGSFEAKMIALNSPVTYRQISRMRTDAGLLKDWLLDKLDNSAFFTRCDLLDRLRAIRVDAIPGEEPEGELSNIGASSQAVLELTKILYEYLIDCICLALNPVCQPCDDPAVLLACVTIEDCKVIDICNMSRRFVLSPAAMRYWLPQISAIGNLVKHLCCDLDLPEFFAGKQKDDNQPPQSAIEHMLMQSPKNMPIVHSFVPIRSAETLDDDARVVLSNLSLEPGEIEGLSLFSTNLALLSARADSIDPGAASLRKNIINKIMTDRFGSITEVSAADDPAIRERISSVVEENVRASHARVKRDLNKDLARTVDASVSALRKDIEEELEEKLVDDIAKNVNKDLSAKLKKSLTSDVNASVKNAVAKEITETKLKRAIESTTAVKELIAENRKLARELKKVSDGLDKLKAGGES